MQCDKNFNTAIFSDNFNLKKFNVKRCIIVILSELYTFILLSVTIIEFQGHSSVDHF